ncbi:oxidoreductase, partial [Mycobacterium tuberculosis]
RQVAAAPGARLLLGAPAVAVPPASSRRVVSLPLAAGPAVGCRPLLVAAGARSPLGRPLGRRWPRAPVSGVAVRGSL